MENTLHYGDNLKVMRESIPDDSVDLVYLDPPFNSQATYNILFKEESGDFAPSQIKAFSDTWHWPDAVNTYEDLKREAPELIRRFVEGLYDFMGPCAMMAYLVMMTPRLLELKRVLKSTGSLFLHCDGTASHYLKLLLDQIFGAQNYRNEIIWKRSLGHHLATKRLDIMSDTIFFYTKSNDYSFNPVYYQISEEEIDKKFPFIEEETGKRFTHRQLEQPQNKKSKGEIRVIQGKEIRTEQGWRWSQETIDRKLEDNPYLIYWTRNNRPRYKLYADQYHGHKIGNIWDDVQPLSSMDSERLGYPTQKPVALLERIVAMASNPCDIVLDPFCGCGTTIEAAEKLNRNWIGIDLTHLAIQLVRKRLADAFKEKCQYRIHGIPEDYGSAKALAIQDKYEFQWWSLSLVDGRPFGGEDAKKKGKDRGIDGIFSFKDDEKRKSKFIVISVKGGKTGPAHIRDLKGTVEREKASMGILITLDPPTKEMKIEAVSAGVYESELFKKRYPKIQIISVKEYFEDNQRAELPRFTGRSIDFKKAKKVIKENDNEQNNLKI
jgi:site-specific DNA-methyltransferase (adenine-specific)